MLRSTSPALSAKGKLAEVQAGLRDKVVPVYAQKADSAKKKKKLKPRDQVLESILQALALGVRGFGRESRRVQARLAWVVLQSFSKRRVHHHPKHKDGFSLAGWELEGLFGRGKFNSLNERFGLLSVTPQWWSGRRFTRVYRLEPPIDKILQEWHLPIEGIRPERLIGMDGRAIRRLRKPIASKDNRGISTKVWRKVDLPNKIPVNIKYLHNLYHTLGSKGSDNQRDMSMHPTDKELVTQQDYIGALLKLCKTDIAGHGFLPVHYHEASTGRLYADGLSLQTVPKEIKRAALVGLWEYDFSNCHFAIIDQMAARFSYQCKEIRHYVKNQETKQQVRREIAKRVGITVEQVKAALIMVMYGARLNPWFGRAIIDLVEDHASRLFDDSGFKAIAEDVAAARQVILSKWPMRSYKNLINSLRKPVSLKAKPEVRLAHLLQGVEAMALREVYNLYPNQILLPEHDGFITKRPIDTASVERHVKHLTGYTLSLVESEILLPTGGGFSKT